MRFNGIFTWKASLDIVQKQRLIHNSTYRCVVIRYHFSYINDAHEDQNGSQCVPIGINTESFSSDNALPRSPHITRTFLGKLAIILQIYWRWASKAKPTPIGTPRYLSSRIKATNWQSKDRQSVSQYNDIRL